MRYGLFHGQTLEIWANALSVLGLLLLLAELFAGWVLWPSLAMLCAGAAAAGVRHWNVGDRRKALSHLAGCVGWGALALVLLTGGIADKLNTKPVQLVANVPFDAADVRELEALLRAMAGERLPPDVQVVEIGREVALRQEARFTLVRAYEWRGLAGEAYLLTNVSDRPIVLADTEFDREGVLGVSVENRDLGPGESTNVFVIRRGS